MATDADPMSRVQSISRAAALLALLLSGAAAAAPRNDTPRPELVERALAAYAAVAAEGRIRNPILTLIDYSLPSSQRRLWVLEPDTRKTLFHEFVAHGRGSADPERPERAVRFGNEVGSLRSSLGAFLTGEPYQGAHGYSLRLEGLERGLNDRAEERAIVIHPAEYVSRAFRLQYGRLGRSFGCPALDPSAAPRIIERIRSGSLLYAGGPAS
jgi:L,D-transpeptidase catalytic domain